MMKLQNCLRMYYLQNRLKSNLIFLLILHVMQWDQAIFEISLEIKKNRIVKATKFEKNLPHFLNYLICM
jgi:hypothetical protein